MTAATPEPTKTPEAEELEPTEVVELGDGKQWCPRCPLMARGDGTYAPHEHGKRGMTTEEVERYLKLFKEMEA